MRVEVRRYCRFFIQLCILSLLAIELCAMKNIDVVWNLREQERPDREQQLQDLILHFFSDLKRQTRFENFVIFQYEKIMDSCIWPDLVRRLNSPSLFFTGIGDWSADYIRKFNGNALILHCIPSMDVVRGGIETRGLYHLLYVGGLYGGNRGHLSRLCRNAFNASLYKVIVISNDFLQTKRYYQCQLYPLESPLPFRSKRLVSGAGMDIYDPQFKNMHEATIWTQPDQLPPRTMLERDDNDPASMVGYVGNLLNVYAQRHNATLRYRFPVKFQKHLDAQIIQKYVQNGSVDIAALIYLPSGSYNRTTYSYPYDVTSYGTMVPLPPLIPVEMVPLIIVHVGVMAIILFYMFVHGCLLLYSIVGSWRGIAPSQFYIFFEMIRAMLAQPYTMVARPRFLTKCIYFLISFTCYIVANMYQAYLQSYLTHPPPSGIFVHNLEQAHEAGLQVMFPAIDLPILHIKAYQALLSFDGILVMVEDFGEFMRLRASFDPHYIYPVTQTRWALFAEQQKFFKRRVFFYTITMNVQPFLLLSLPTRPGLPYLDEFNHFILRVHATGLFAGWIASHFSTMVRLGLMTTEDLSRSKFVAEAITLQDFYWIWVGYGFLISMATLAFLLEFPVKRRKSLRSDLKKMFARS